MLPTNHPQTLPNDNSYCPAPELPALGQLHLHASISRKLNILYFSSAKSHRILLKNNNTPPSLQLKEKGWGLEGEEPQISRGVGSGPQPERQETHAFLPSNSALPARPPTPEPGTGGRQPPPLPALPNPQSNSRYRFLLPLGPRHPLTPRRAPSPRNPWSQDQLCPTAPPGRRGSAAQARGGVRTAPPSPPQRSPGLSATRFLPPPRAPGSPRGLPADPRLPASAPLTNP